nr:recombinase family protein [Caldanaerovirga acetigignens]
MYARVSSAKQAGSGNLESQRQRLEEYCRSRGYEIVAFIAEQGSGLNEKRKIVRDLYDKFFPNARWCQWAVEDAETTIDSQKEQVRMHVSDLEAKIEKSEEKTGTH